MTKRTSSDPSTRPKHTGDRRPPPAPPMEDFTTRRQVEERRQDNGNVFPPELPDY